MPPNTTAPVARATRNAHDLAILSPPTVQTFCSDGATFEPWTLVDFLVANAEDPNVADDAAAISGLSIGGSITLGGGAVAETTITRLT